MIPVSDLFAQGAGCIVQLNGLQILAAKIVEISDVVIGPDFQQAKTMLSAVLARQLIGPLGAVGVIQAGVADGQVPQDGGDIMGLAQPQKLLVSRLIQFQRLLKAVLPIEDVGHVAIETGQAKTIAMGCEDVSGFFS